MHHTFTRVFKKVRRMRSSVAIITSKMEVVEERDLLAPAAIHHILVRKG